MQQEKEEISLELVKFRLRLRSDMHTRVYESRALITQPQTIRKSQTLAKNKAEN